MFNKITYLLTYLLNDLSQKVTPDRSRLRLRMEWDGRCFTDGAVVRRWLLNNARHGSAVFVR